MQPFVAQSARHRIVCIARIKGNVDRNWLASDSHVKQPLTSSDSLARAFTYSSTNARGRPLMGRDRTCCPVRYRFKILYPWYLLIPHSLHTSATEHCPQRTAKCTHFAKAALSVSLSSRPSRSRTPLGALIGLNRGSRTVCEGVSLRFHCLSLTGRVRASP